MVYCVVKACKNHSNKKNIKHKKITYHLFPKKDEIKQKWIQAINRDNWLPQDKSTICSKHFTADSFKTGKNGRRFLTSGAVPGLFLLDQGNTCDCSHSEKQTSASNSRPKTSADIKQGAEHRDVSCDHCKAKVYGFRYKCVECADCDLCSACEARGEHPDHYVLRIPQPLQFRKVQALIEHIRHSLADEGICQINDVALPVNLQDVDSEDEKLAPIKVEPLEEIVVEIQEDPLIDLNAMLTPKKDQLDANEVGFRNQKDETKETDALFVQNFHNIGETEYSNRIKKRYNSYTTVSSIEENDIYDKKAKTEFYNEPSSSDCSVSLLHPHILQEECPKNQKSTLSGLSRKGS